MKKRPAHVPPNELKNSLPEVGEEAAEGTARAWPVGESPAGVPSWPVTEHETAVGWDHGGVVQGIRWDDDSSAHQTCHGSVVQVERLRVCTHLDTWMQNGVWNAVPVAVPCRAVQCCLLPATSASRGRGPPHLHLELLLAPAAPRSLVVAVHVAPAGAP